MLIDSPTKTIHNESRNFSQRDVVVVGWKALTNFLYELALFPQYFFKYVVGDLIMAFLTLRKDFNRVGFRALEKVITTKAFSLAL